VDPQLSRAIATTARGPETPASPAAGLAPGARRGWPVEVWLSFRPYFIALTIDFLIFVMLWLGLRGGHALASRLALAAPLVAFLNTSYGVAVVASFVFVCSLALYDIGDIHRRRS
jgi:hypothetical protein